MQGYLGVFHDAEHVENNDFPKISENHPGTSRTTPEDLWWFLNVPWMFLDRFWDHEFSIILHDSGRSWSVFLVFPLSHGNGVDTIVIYAKFKINTYR